MCFTRDARCAGFREPFPRLPSPGAADADRPEEDAAMTIPQLSRRTGRARWLKIAAAVWLLLVSGIAMAVVNSAGLSRLTEQTQQQRTGCAGAGAQPARRRTRTTGQAAA